MNSEKESFSIEELSKLLKWFGPMKKQNMNDTHLLERLERIMQNKWFFGPMGRDEVEKKLKTQPIGSFLVRTNLGRNFTIEEVPFMVARRTAVDIRHTCIHRNAKGELLTGNFGDKDTPKSVQINSNVIEDLIKKLESEYADSFTLVCPDWPYEKLFHLAAPINAGLDKNLYEHVQ